MGRGREEREIELDEEKKDSRGRRAEREEEGERIEEGRKGREGAPEGSWSLLCPTRSHLAGLPCRRRPHKAKTTGQKQGDQERLVLRWQWPPVWAKVAGRNKDHGAAHSGGL